MRYPTLRDRYQVAVPLQDGQVRIYGEVGPNGSRKLERTLNKGTYGKALLYAVDFDNKRLNLGRTVAIDG